MNICVYGGQYGSEGKGSAAEHFARGIKKGDNLLVVAGENAPNSGHTCSIGKTRNMPVSSFYGDYVMLGPDSVIDAQCLIQDLDAIANHRKGKKNVPDVFIHEHAAILLPSHRKAELAVVASISSTGSGSGAAKVDKYFHRYPTAVVGSFKATDIFKEWASKIQILNRSQWIAMTAMLVNCHWIFECSQGVMLDTNWGIYPYVTSRTTQPRVAIERSGLGRMDWKYAGVFRTYPIRTGGPSGPTGGAEVTFGEIGVPDEIATVTKRLRRVFEFSYDDFAISCVINRPDILVWTHLDYLGLIGDLFDKELQRKFITWMEDYDIDSQMTPGIDVYISNKTGSLVKL